MDRLRSLLAASLVIWLGACPAKTPSSSALAASAPAPPMPANWKVKADQSFGAQEVAKISESLKGELVALRNTSFDVDGQALRISTMVAKTDADADSIFASLKSFKPEEFLLRRGRTLYEFVGKNSAIPAMKAGRAHLAR